VLAAELAVNQNTILRVYERLTAEGLLERRHGDGTFVADQVPTGQLEAQRQRLRQEMARVVELARTLGVDAEELHRLLDDEVALGGQISSSSGLPPQANQGEHAP
jgi:GntR family transcriptional regulator